MIVDNGDCDQENPIEQQFIEQPEGQVAFQLFSHLKDYLNSGDSLAYSDSG